MKRSMIVRTLLLGLFLTITCQNVCGQDEKGISFLIEKMNETMKTQNRDPGKFFHCDINQKATVGDYKAMRNLTKGYVFGEYKYKEGNPNNSRKWKLLYFEFLPFEGMAQLVYEKFQPFDLPYSEMKNSGYMWIYTGDDMSAHYTSSWKAMAADKKGQPNMVSERQLFYKCKAVNWSGNIKDGFIDGEGIGMVYYNLEGSDKYYWACFKGTFNKGFPHGKTLNKYFDTTIPQNTVASGEKTFYLSEFYDEEALLTDSKGKSLAMINTAGKGTLVPEDESVYSTYLASMALKDFYKLDKDPRKLDKKELEILEKWYILQQMPLDIPSYASFLPSGNYKGKKPLEIWTNLVKDQCMEAIKSGKSPYLTNSVIYIVPITNIHHPIYKVSQKATTWRKGIEQLPGDFDSDKKELGLMFDVIDGLYFLDEDKIDEYQTFLHTRKIFILVPSLYTQLINSNYSEILEQSVSSAQKLIEQNHKMKSELSKRKKTLEEWVSKSREIVEEAKEWQLKKDQEGKDEGWILYPFYQ